MRKVFKNRRNHFLAKSFVCPLGGFLNDLSDMTLNREGRECEYLFSITSLFFLFFRRSSFLSFSFSKSDLK